MLAEVEVSVVISPLVPRKCVLAVVPNVVPVSVVMFAEVLAILSNVTLVDLSVVIVAEVPVRVVTVPDVALRLEIAAEVADKLLMTTVPVSVP